MGAGSLRTMRANVFIGFPLGGLLSVAIAAAAAIVLRPRASRWPPWARWRCRCSSPSGKLGAGPRARRASSPPRSAPRCETGLSVGYSVAQYFGWQWGKFVEPLRAARFHTVVLLSCVAGVGILLTTVDPILVTEYSVVFSALALPLTYLPILVVANDRTYLGQHVNGRVANLLGTVYLVVVVGGVAGRDTPHGLTGAGHDAATPDPAGPIEAGTPLSLGLRLLDHQILGREQEMVGNVDDVALEERDGRLVAVGLLRGTGAWAQRQPGALGRWGRAIWRRLDPRADPRPLVLPLDHVVCDRLGGARRPLGRRLPGRRRRSGAVAAPPRGRQDPRRPRR